MFGKKLATGDEAITCQCACMIEKGEMVCCDVFGEWSHLRYLGMKEGVGVLKGKLFVCHFCLFGAEIRAGLCKQGIERSKEGK